MDGIDPSEAPGVGTAGTRLNLVIAKPTSAGRPSPRRASFGSIEVTEINRSGSNTIALPILAVELILSALGKTTC